MIKTNYFTNKDIAIALDKTHWYTNINNNGITSSKTIYEKLCEKIKGFEKMNIKDNYMILIRIKPICHYRKKYYIYRLLIFEVFLFVEINLN